MLQELHKTFEQQADRIISWRKMNKNVLINECVRHENDPEYQAYFSAIVCRYWNNIYKLYGKSSNSVSIEECYNWLIDAIMYTLKHKNWLDPNKNLYGDPNGPDKMLNQCIKSERLIFYQGANAANRRLNYGVLSSDQLEEDYKDAPFPFSYDSNLAQIEDCTTTLITNSFDKKDYFTALLINCIAFGQVFDITHNIDNSVSLKFNKKKLLSSIRRLNNKQFIEYFSSKFKFDKQEVKTAVELCSNLPYWKLNNSITRNLNLLKKNKLLIGGNY